MSAALSFLQRGPGPVSLTVGTGAITFYILLRLRLLPKKVMQSWFVFSCLVTVFGMSGVLYLTDPLQWIGMPRYYLERFRIILLVWAFRACYHLNPQIKMQMTFDKDVEGKSAVGEKGWGAVPHSGVAIVMNHTSFWDVFALICMTPYSFLMNTRTLMKASLRKIPIFGGIFDRVGHFPVYFKSDADGNFSVDKERQAAVQKNVDRHINEGGNIALFPEGAVNRNPPVLQTFRFGTFATIFQHKMKVAYMVMVGNEKTWPGHSGLGGLPADIRIRFGYYPIDFDQKDSKQVAVEMQAYMQTVYNEILAEQAAEHKTTAQAPTAAAAAAPNRA